MRKGKGQARQSPDASPEIKINKIETIKINVDELMEPYLMQAVSTLVNYAFAKPAGHYAIVINATVNEDGFVDFNWDWYATARRPASSRKPGRRNESGRED